MNESIYHARKELVRAEQLLFVSLKQSRNVDVIKNTIKRLISAFDFGIDALLIYSKEKKKINEVPTLVRLKLDELRKVFGDNEQIMSYLEFYNLLRKLDKAKFDRSLEYRRYVTMTAFIDEGDVLVDIDILGDYYKKSVDFINLVDDIINEAEKE